MRPHWPLLAVAATMIGVVAATILKTIEVDNTLAWLFVGSALTLIGEWAAIEISNRARGDDSDQERERRP